MSLFGRVDTRVSDAEAARDAAEHRVLVGLTALNAALEHSRSCPCRDQCPCRDGLLDVFAALTRGGAS